MNITKGPWKGGQSIQSESGLFICRVLSSFDGWKHASDKQKFYSSKAPQNNETEANARAIALVPEMIEALQNCLDWSESRDGSPEADEAALCDIVNISRTILKRIEG